MWTSAELKLRAKGAFFKNYWQSVLVAFVMSIFGMIGPDLIYEWIQDRESIVYVDRMFGTIGDFFFFSIIWIFRIQACGDSFRGFVFGCESVSWKSIRGRRMPFLYKESDNEPNSGRIGI